MSHLWVSTLKKGKSCSCCKESISRFTSAKKCDCGVYIHEKCIPKFHETCTRPFFDSPPALPPSPPSSPVSTKKKEEEEPHHHQGGRGGGGRGRGGGGVFCGLPTDRGGGRGRGRGGGEEAGWAPSSTMPLLNPALSNAMQNFNNDAAIMQTKPSKSLRGPPGMAREEEVIKKAKIFDFLEKNAATVVPKHTALRQLKAIIFQWGGHEDWEIEKLSFAEKIVKISAGGSHCIALAANGRAFVWGRQRRGTGVLATSMEAEEIKDPQIVQQLADCQVTDVSAGTLTSSAITLDGKLFIWGYRLDQGVPSCEPGEVPAFEGMAVRAIEFTIFSALVLIQTGKTNEDTEVWTWGENNLLLGHKEGDKKEDSTFPRRVEALVDESVVQISISETHCTAVTAKGNIFVWGCNAYSACDDEPASTAVLGTSISAKTKWIYLPEKVVFRGEERIRIIQAACGKRFTIALTDQGRLMSWGQDNYGCLGLGLGDMDSPTFIEKIPGGEKEKICFRGIRCGGTHNIAWTDEGTIYSWGNGGKYRLGSPDSDADVKFLKPIKVLEKEGFSNAVVFQIACTFERSLAFVGPDSALFDYGGSEKVALTASQCPTVGDVLSHIAPTMGCDSQELMMLGEDYGELFPKTAIRSIIMGVDSVFYIVRRSTIVQKKVSSGHLLMEEGVVKGGTRGGLVDYMLSRWCSDPEFGKNFLLTYRMLGMTSSDVLNVLLERYFEPAELENVPESFPEEVQLILGENIPLKRKVLDVLLFWITNYQDDFFGSELKNAENISNILNLLLQISHLPLQNICTEIHRKLLFEMSVEMSETDMVLASLNALIASSSSSTPASFSVGSAPSPSSSDGLFLKYSAKEVAEQLTYIDSTFIKALPLHEFVATKWIKKELAPNVTRMAVRCTHMVYWAEAELLKAKTLKERLKLVERFFELAEALFDMGNFPGFMNITAVFGRKPVRQIPDLLKSIRKNKEMSVRLEAIQEKSGVLFKAAKWRGIFDQHPLPKLPFLGPIQTELVYINDTPKYLDEFCTEEKKIYNYARAEKTAELLFDISRYQTATYNIKVIPELLHYLYFARGFDDHENTAKQLTQALKSKEEVSEDLIDTANHVELYDVSSSSDVLTEDTATILLNSRVVLACLTKKERKKLWLNWGERLQYKEPLKKAKLQNVLGGIHWKCVSNAHSDFREILLGSEGLDVSIQSFLQQPPEGEEEGKALRRMLGLFTTVIDVDLFYETISLLSLIQKNEIEKSKGKNKEGKGEWESATQFISNAVKLYKFLARHEIVIMEHDKDKFRIELQKEKNQCQSFCNEDSLRKIMDELRIKPPKFDGLWSSFKWIKTRKQLLASAMADIQEVLVDGLVGETTQFLGELKKKRDEAVKNQVLMEIEWLKSVQAQTQNSLALLENSLKTGILPAAPPCELTPVRASGSKVLNRKNLLNSVVMGHSSLTVVSVPSSSLPASGNVLPPHLNFLNASIDKYPQPHPLAETQMNTLCTSVEGFLQGNHLCLVKRCETFFANLSELAKELEDVYCEAVIFMTRFYVQMLEMLSSIANPDQMAGFQGMLSSCIDGIQRLHLDISTVGVKHSQVMEDIQTAAFLLETPKLLQYQGK